MNQEDLMARFLYLAKEDIKLQTSKINSEKLASKLRAAVSELQGKIRHLESHARSQTNLVCDLKGQQTALKSMMTEESKEKVVKTLQGGGYFMPPKRGIDVEVK